MKMKALIEQRDAKKKQLNDMINAAETENRSLTAEETSAFDALEAEIRAIDDTITRAEKAKTYAQTSSASDSEQRSEDAEERAFADYVMGKAAEMRSGEQNVTMTNNGAIIPTSIANRIIKEIKDRCPILEGSTMYAVKGILKVPVWGKANNTHNIAVGFQSEFTDITADAGKFTSVDLGGYLAGALTLIGRSVENNSAFNVTAFIIEQMATEIASWIEGHLLVGTCSNAPQGATNTTNTVTAASTTAITADELITLQASVKQAYQAKACWTMNPATFTAIKKLKDSNNRYLLQDDITGEFPYRLLGKPVYLSDNMPIPAAGAKTVLYGDYSGLSVNFREKISIEVLREKFATMHAIGVVAWMEFDSKVTNNQKLAVLVQASA